MTVAIGPGVVFGGYRIEAVAGRGVAPFRRSPPRPRTWG